MGTKKWDGLSLYSSYKTFIGQREVELDSEISRAELPAIVGKSAEPPLDPEYSEPLPSQARSSFLVDAARERRTSQEGTGSSSPSVTTVNSPASAKKFIPPASFYGTAVKPKPKGPLYAYFWTGSLSRSTNFSSFRHDPDAPGAVVMKAPTKDHQAKYNKKWGFLLIAQIHVLTWCRNLPVVPVVIDPVIVRHLRPHQKEGELSIYSFIRGASVEAASQVSNFCMSA